jgi:hypothetical protein
MIRKSVIGFALAALIAASAPLMAAVTFDPATGTGFVGKGDVQSAFGWNNAGLQQNAAGVTFGSRETQRRFKDCVDNDRPNDGQIRLVDERTQSKNINASVQYDARTHKQIDGFILNGYGAITQDGGLVQQFCPAGFHPANGDEVTGWTDWQTVVGSDVLYAYWGGNGVQIYP